MPKRALVEKRPWLVASLVTAAAYFIWSDEYVDGLTLFILKGIPVALLAIYALMRHASLDGRWVAGVMAASALGDWAIELSMVWGGAFFAVAHVLAIALYRRNRRARYDGSQLAAAGAFALLTPIIAYGLSRDPMIAIYAAILGAMAATAWLSQFSRYRVGLGAALFVISDLLIFAKTGQVMSDSYSAWLVWPTYYVGQFLICTGIIQQLRRDGSSSAA